MTPEQLAALKGEFKSIVDVAVKESIKEIAGKEVADQVGKIVRKLRADRALYGTDKSGIDEDMKLAFIKDLRAIARGEKATLLESNDTSGGYLVPAEVHAGIMRIAASVGIVSRDAQRLPMSSDELNVPRYTGADLEGAYVGEDTEGSPTAMSFGDARLVAKTWMTIFRVSNSLMADANVDVADWLMGLVAEGLASRMDKEGFIGGTFAGSPFVGLLGSTEVTSFSLPSGVTTFAGFTADHASDAIAQVEESILPDCAFYFHRTVWAKIRQQKTANGMYTVGQNNSMIAANFKKDGIKPAGVLWDYPVYTVDHLPANSATAVNTNFAVFGSLKHGLLLGDRQALEFAKSDSATVGGKNVFAANQTAIRATHRHALAVGLPSAIVLIKTAAS